MIDGRLTCTIQTMVSWSSRLWIVACSALGAVGCGTPDSEPGYEIVEPGPTVLLTSENLEEVVVVEVCSTFRSTPAPLTGLITLNGVADGAEGVFDVRWKENAEPDATRFGWTFPIAEFESDYPSPTLELEECPVVDLVFQIEEASTPAQIDYDVVLTVEEHFRPSSTMLSVRRR